MSRNALIVMTTCEDAARGRELARALVGEALAACVNLIPGVTSVYSWAGRVETGSEVLLLIKTTDDRLADVESAIRARSSYELPEIVAVPVAGGSLDYLQWVADSVKPAHPDS